MDPGAIEPRNLLWNIGKALLAVFLVVILIGVFFREPMELAASEFVSRFGLAGVFIAALMLDALPGLGSQPIVILACAGGMPGGAVWLAASLGSWLSGSMGWVTGLGLARWPWFRGWITRVGLEAGLLKYGRRAVFLAALAPFPYGLVTMAAGAAGLPWREVGIGATGRFVKVGLNVVIVVMGWGATG